MLHRRTFLTSSIALAALPGAIRAAPRAPFKLYDTHVHFHSADVVKYPFRPDMDPALKAHTIARPLTPEAMIGIWDDLGVEMGCGIQTDYVYHTDNRYLLDIAEDHPRRISPVVILDATNPATPAAIESMVKAYRISGVRFAGGAGTDGNYPFLTSAGQEAWQTANDLGLAVALLLVPGDQDEGSSAAMDRIGSLAVQYPRVRFVLDHLGYPAARSTPTFGFSAAHLALARHGNIYYKYTTLAIARLLKGGVPVSDFLDYAVGTYGPDKLVWGSSAGANLVQFAGRYPQGKLLADPSRYAEVVQLALDSARGLTLAQKKALFFENAKALFVSGGAT